VEGLIALPTGQRGLVTQTQRRLSISRISIPATIEAAPAASQPLFPAVKKQLGVAPICSGSQPTAQLRSRATSAHTYLGRNVAKLDDAEITANRNGASNDPRADAAVRFVVRVTQPRGHVSNEEFAAVKAAGYTDAQIIEIVQHVALNTWTSYINTVAQTEIEPLVLPSRIRCVPLPPGESIVQLSPASSSSSKRAEHLQWQHQAAVLEACHAARPPRHPASSIVSCDVPLSLQTLAAPGTVANSDRRRPAIVYANAKPSWILTQHDERIRAF
jgi:hypothetical protein